VAAGQKTAVNNAPAGRYPLLPLSLEQVSAARPAALRTWRYPVIIGLGPSPAEAALVRALALVTERHEPLRLRLVNRPVLSNGITAGKLGLWQRFAPPADDFPLDVVGCASPTAADQLASQFFGRELDLFEDGPLRACLVRPDGEQASLLLAVHHLAWDAVSKGIFTRDLRAAYQAFSADTEPALPALRVSYAQHVERQWRAGKRLTAVQASYWDEVFRDWDDREDPGTAALREPPAGSGPWSACLEGGLPGGGLQAEIQRIARSVRLTPASVWLTAVLVALWSPHGRGHVCVYWVHHGRDRSDLVDLVGFFNRSLPVRARLDPEQRFDQVCAEVAAQVRASIQHSAPPWSILRLGEHVLGPRGAVQDRAGRPRLARVTVNLRTRGSGGRIAVPRRGDAATVPDGPAAAPRAARPGTPRPGQLWLDLAVDTALPVRAEFDRRVFPDSMVGTALTGLAAVLEAIARSGPQTTISELREAALQGT
jgi:Condensation domain